MASFVAVARAEEIPPGTGKQVAIGARAIAVFNVGGAFYAMDGACVHEGGPVGEGALDGATVTCPRHGYRYDVTSGRLITDRARGLRKHDARVVDGIVEVAVRD